MALHCNHLHQHEIHHKGRYFDSVHISVDNQHLSLVTIYWTPITYHTLQTSLLFWYPDLHCAGEEFRLECCRPRYRKCEWIKWCHLVRQRMERVSLNIGNFCSRISSNMFNLFWDIYYKYQCRNIIFNVFSNLFSILLSLLSKAL